jgi:glycosyltransferase involved in cell wall biosynthesis
VVVDEINTIPFMTPRFVNRGEKIIALIHQLAREFWFYELPYPIAWLGYHYFENHWLEYYKDFPTITVSSSSMNELVALGFQNVKIVQNGLNAQPLSKVDNKTPEPTLLFIGRMKKAKKPRDVLEAYRILQKSWPSAQLTMVGDGYLLRRLRKDYPDVVFTGFVDSDTRDRLVKSSWVLAVPGIREGWGQVVTDANALGTPAVGYDIPGLRDSIKDGYSGLLVDPDPRSMAEGLQRILAQEDLRRAMSSNAIEWSKRFSWDESTDAFEAILKQ